MTSAIGDLQRVLLVFLVVCLLPFFLISVALSSRLCYLRELTSIDQERASTWPSSVEMAEGEQFCKSHLSFLFFVHSALRVTLRTELELCP